MVGTVAFQNPDQVQVRSHDRNAGWGGDIELLMESNLSSESLTPPLLMSRLQNRL